MGSNDQSARSWPIALQRRACVLEETQSPLMLETTRAKIFKRPDRGIAYFYVRIRAHKEQL